MANAAAASAVLPAWVGAGARTRLHNSEATSALCVCLYELSFWLGLRASGRWQAGRSARWVVCGCLWA